MRIGERGCNTPEKKGPVGEKGYFPGLPIRMKGAQ